LIDQRRAESRQISLGEMMGELDKNDVKEALKEGMREWLDEKFAIFGKWSLAGLGAMALTALCYFILSLNGWHK
jgi:hypothetical protein